MNKKPLLQPEGGLLQSRQWADFLHAKGEDVVSVGEGEERVFGVVYTLKIVGKYLYIPRVGVRNISPEDIEKFIDSAKQNDCGWIRIDISTKEQLQQLEHLSLSKAPHDMQSRENFIIDITSSEEELLRAMKSKTRYNIKLAQKKNVAVHCVTKTDQDFEQMLGLFYTMIEQTARRKGVRFHSKDHYQKMFDALPEEMITLFAAEVDGGVFIAANIVTFYGSTAAYLHGATADTHRNFMAPFALQWAAIRAAKGRGCQYYDFGGVQTVSAKSGSDWAGITRFKQGFAPNTTPTTGQGSYDIILDPKRYYLYRILQKAQEICVATNC